MNHLKNFSWSAIGVMCLLLFIIVNPSTNLDLFAFLCAGFIILQKILGEYFILALLALRPTLDYWRDYNLFTARFFNFNINAALSVFLLVWSVIFFVKNRAYIKQIPLAGSWVAFIAWCTISLVYTYDFSSTITEALKLANLFGLFGIFYIMTKKNQLQFQKTFLVSAFGAAIIPIGVGIYQFSTKTGMDIDDISNRIYGTFAHPNVLATFTLALLMITINEIIDRKNKADPKNKTNIFDIYTEPELKIAAIILLIVIALTYTRIVWIGTAALCGIIGLFYYRKLLLYGITIIVTCYTLFFPVNRYLVNNYNINLQANSLITRLTSRNEDADSVRWRTNLITKIIPLFKQHAIVGYGYGTFARVWDDNKDIENLWDNTSEAHNDYVKIAFESGIIGLMLFLLIFTKLIYTQITIGVQQHWRNIVFIASIFIYLILSLSDNMLRHTPVIWWLWATWGTWSAVSFSKKPISK